LELLEFKAEICDRMNSLGLFPKGKTVMKKNTYYLFLNKI